MLYIVFSTLFTLLSLLSTLLIFSSPFFVYFVLPFCQLLPFFFLIFNGNLFSFISFSFVFISILFLSATRFSSCALLSLLHFLSLCSDVHFLFIFIFYLLSSWFCALCLLFLFLSILLLPRPTTGLPCLYYYQLSASLIIYTFLLLAHSYFLLYLLPVCLPYMSELNKLPCASYYF